MASQTFSFQKREKKKVLLFKPPRLWRFCYIFPKHFDFATKYISFTLYHTKLCICLHPIQEYHLFCVLVSLAPKTMNAYEFVLNWFSLKYPDFKFRLHFLGHPEHTMRRQHLETGFCAFFPFNYSEHAAGRVNHTAQLWWMASAVPRAL